MTKTNPEATQEAALTDVPNVELLVANEEITRLKAQAKQYSNLLRSVMTQRDKAINEAADLGAKILELEELLQEARSNQ